MKKIAALVLLLSAVVVIAGCKNANQNQNENQNKGTIQNKEQEKEKEGVISSIKDAMGLGQKMKCSYSFSYGGQTEESVVYVDGKKYMSSYAMGEKKTNSYFDGEMSYTWEEGAKTGTKISAACLKEIGEMSQSQNQEQQQNQYKAGEEAFEDAMDVKCEPTNEDISLPEGIAFTDQCDQMKAQIQSMQEMMKKYQNMGQ